MELTTTFELTTRQNMAAYRACHRTTYYLIWIINAVLLLNGILERSPALIAGPVAIVAAAELAIYLQQRPHTRRPHPVTVTMTDDEYRTSCPDCSTTRHWSTFTKLQRRGDYWILRLSWAAAIALPASALDDAQTATFLDLARHKNLLPTNDTTTVP